MVSPKTSPRAQRLWSLEMMIEPRSYRRETSWKE
jgi:hypothetical protein